MSERAYRKYTKAVDKGIRYAIAALENDSMHELFDPVKGGPLEGTTRSEDLQAAAAWLRYQRDKHAQETDSGS